MEAGHRRGRRFLRGEEGRKKPSAAYQRVAAQRQRAVRERRARVLSWAERHVYGIVVASLVAALFFLIVLGAYLYPMLPGLRSPPAPPAQPTHTIPWRRDYTWLLPGFATHASQFATVTTAPAPTPSPPPL